MTPFVALVLGLALGGGIGHYATWLFLMNKYGGRPVDYWTMLHTFVITLGVLGFFFGGRIWF